MPFRDPEKRRRASRESAARRRAKNPMLAAESSRRWRLDESNRRRALKLNRAYLAGIRLTAIEVYSHGAMACSDCGYSIVDALCIDHVHDDGKQHRRSVGAGPSFWLWLKRNHYPAGFQVLCHNCNFLKELRRRRRQKQMREQRVDAENSALFTTDVHP